MAEKALSDKTNLHSRSRDQGSDTYCALGPTTNAKGSSVSKDNGEKSVRPKEKNISPIKTGQKQKSGSESGRRRPGSQKPSQMESRRRAVEVDVCKTQLQRGDTGSQRGSRLSAVRGSVDKRTFQPISSKCLKDLLQIEPSKASILLGSLKGIFSAGLEEPHIDAVRQRLFWDVLAHISDNVGAESTVIMLLTVVVSSKLLNTHLPLHLINLRATAKQSGTHECLGFIAVLITVFEAMITCIPSRAAEIKVPLVLMTDVVNSLEGQLTQDVKSPLVALVQYIESLEAEKELSRQKQRNASSKPPPDDFRQQSILPTYQELMPSYQPYLRPHIVKGVYPNANHYLDVQFRLMKEDFIQPLRSGLSQYLRNKQVSPKDRVKVQDIRIYENVELVKPVADRSGVSYRMSFKRIPHVRWEMSKRLIYGSLVLLSEDDFKTYIPATVANRDVRQLAHGSVDIRPLDVGMASIVDKTFVMVESTVFFEAYRHVLVGLQRVSPETFPMSRHILDLDHDIKPPTYLLDLSNPKIDVSNLMADRKSETKVAEIPKTQSKMTTAPVRFQQRHSPTHIPKDQKATDTPFPISVLNEDTWPTSGKTKLNPSQLEAVKVALTQELSLIQGPPGTGKTYIGLKIVETLLKNIHYWSHEETGPILLVCYTNHALDQFLLGIKQFHDTGIIRVGSRSKCTELEEHNLKNVIRENRYSKDKSNQYIRRRAGTIKDETVLAKQTLEAIQIRMQLSTQGIVRETEFKRFQIMSDRHFRSMTRIKTIGHADSWMLEWLVPCDLSANDLEQNLEKGSRSSNKDEETKENNTQEHEASTESIDVENERELIEGQRLCDDDLEDDDISEEKSAKKNDFPLAVYFEDLMSSNDINSGVKNFMREKISMQKRMNESVVSTIRDVWRLDIHQRWTLYHYWLSKYASMLEAEIPVIQNEYIQLCAELQETNDHEKCLVLQQATIVGMTTTRAANEREVLHRVKPKIIIVEEAAEVLESHIITSLHTSCEQLILIGDHQQLRPKPNVYHLATRFHLDVSMFERLVKNGFPYKKLKQQHRMRPEISSLMRQHFYPELEDHESVSFYNDVRGVEKNVFFLEHTEAEAHVSETMSHFNLYEVDFTVALCKYLLNQDYKPQQITILTAYTGQLLKFKEKMDRATFEGVTVASVDNYQGEENDIILLSFVRSSQNGKIGFLNIANRVCVSLSRAKQGLYCIGNFTLYSEKCDLWKGIYGDLQENCRIGNKMVLQCYNHPQNKTVVARADDFRKVPDGGCGIPCDTLLDCGHVCTKLCHPKDRLHQEYVCPEPCTSTCEKGHVCSDICGNKCPPCQTKMEKKLPCRHVRIMKCSTVPARVKCQVIVERTKLPCHHILTLRCHQDIDNVDCTEIVDRVLQCGHTKTEKCSEHGSCSVIVTKDLPCGHNKMMECSKAQQPDIVCTKMILKVLPCSHTKDLKCNVRPETALCLKLVTKKRQSCGHLVTEKCSAESDCTDIVNKSLPCGHNKDVKCCEDVNEVFCEEKCEKNLACGHKCTELCGNACVTKCKEFVVRRDWPCGHEVTARCSDEPDTCKVRCETKLECGHMCKGTCGKCMGGRYHVPCGEKCHRFLVCGHQCTLRCVSPCLPCQERCQNFCEHIKCNHPCGEICNACTKQCSWKCPHHTCRMLCCETCSRPPCNEPCSKKLTKCGHPCSGLCGEICPQLCRICDKEVLIQTSFGSQDIETLRYIQLEECGHVFEVTGLDKHIGLNQTEITNTLISLKRCPKCRTPLRHSRRYGNVLKLARRNVMHVKKKLEKKNRQVTAETLEMQRRMKNILTRRNLEPLGIGQSLIGKWLREHREITMEHAPAMTRLQLIRTLMELQRILSEANKETQRRQSVRNECITETQGNIAVLANAILRDATSFSYQQAHDLHKEMCRIVYTVLLLIQLRASKGRQSIQPLDDSLGALRRKASLRDEDLERIRSIIEDYYETTGGRWPDNIQEFHLHHQVTFARERWYRCPKGHTCMIEEDGSSIPMIDCEICLHSRTRVVLGDQRGKGLTEDQIRRLATEVPSCGLPGKMPYNKRSVQNSPNNPVDSGPFNRSQRKVESSTQEDTRTGKTKNKRNDTQCTLPTASTKHKSSAVVQKESETNRRKRRNKNAKEPRKTHTEGIEERKPDVSSSDRKALQHTHGARANDQTSGNKVDRATHSSRGASQGTPSKSDGNSKHKGKPRGEVTASDGKTVQSNASKSKGPDQRQSETSRRRNRGRAGGQGGGLGGGNNQMDNQEGRRSDDAQRPSGTVEHGSSNSRRRIRRRKGKGN